MSEDTHAMTIPTDNPPFWLAWVVPLATVAGIIGAGLVWVGRALFLPGVKRELESMLKDKFDAVEANVQMRDMRNQQKFTEIEEQMEDAARDRQQMLADFSEIREGVAYLRGKASGTFKRP